MINLSRYITLLILLTNINLAQVYLGMIDKEGIFLNDNMVFNKYSYDYVQDQLKKITYDSYNNVIFDNYQKEFEIFTKINKGDKFFIACSESVTQETVSGFIVYDWYGITKEFYPLISNKTNLCKISEDYDKNLVIISKYPINETISFNHFIDSETIVSFKKRVLEDVRNFDVPGEYDEVHKKYKKEFIQAVYDDNLSIFKGNFCHKNTDEYFVSYIRGGNEENCVNVNYVMDLNANVIEYFTTPREVFEYSSIIGICDYDNDGLDELIISKRYYEGGGYELWKYEDNKFIKVTDGFYFGV